jgi:Ca-activated chloride channel family protein
MSQRNQLLILATIALAGCSMHDMDAELDAAPEAQTGRYDLGAASTEATPTPALLAKAPTEAADAPMPDDALDLGEVAELEEASMDEDREVRGEARQQAAPRKSRANKPMGMTAGGATASIAPSSIAPPAPPADPAPIMDLASNTEDYVHYGVNDMTLVENDGLSTFSIDVDTASYTIARSKLNSGTLPPAAAVRVEEFVNYFPYDYAPPSAGSNGGAPFAVHMEAAPSPYGGNHHLLRVGVKGEEIDRNNRAPVHLTFLVDTSGSMSSADKLGLAKASLHTMVSNLDEEDTVSLVTYAGDTRVVLEATSTVHAKRIHAAIDDLTSGGGTAMSSGMELAYRQASATYAHGTENRVVVLSDGDANIGRTSHDEILRTIEQYAEEGITLTTVGFGMGNYKDTMMEQLANKGDGNYFYVDSQAEADKVFGEDLSGTIQTIAKDVKIQVEFNPEAVIGYRLIGYENRDIADKDFRNDRVDAGEIGSGHNVTAIYDVVLKDDAQSMELATVRLRAKKPGPDSAAKEWATVFDGELLHSEFASASDDFRLAVAAAGFAELLRNSPYMVESSFAEVQAIARGAAKSDEAKELVKLIGVAGGLAGESGSVATR